MVDGTVRIVKELQENPDGEKRASEQKVVKGKCKSVGDGAESCESGSDELIAGRAEMGIKGDGLDKVNGIPLPEHAPSVVESLVSGVSGGVAKTGEVLDSTWTVAKTVLFGKHDARPKL
ncbi:hypothetical protein FS749_002260 [Ceratobasidium sp. UAMH 11750]|nr:hypothetical protein FS749_002260 [Ceratobasidium sp. UAMH 11750]